MNVFREAYKNADGLHLQVGRCPGSPPANLKLPFGELAGFWTSYRHFTPINVRWMGWNRT